MSNLLRSDTKKRAPIERAREYALRAAERETTGELKEALSLFEAAAALSLQALHHRDTRPEAKNDLRELASSCLSRAEVLQGRLGVAGKQGDSLFSKFFSFSPVLCVTCLFLCLFSK